MQNDKIKRRSIVPTESERKTGTSRLIGRPLDDDGTINLTTTPTAPPNPVNAGTRDGAATKCIYFKSANDVNQVERLVEGIPTASVSSIISQLLSAFIQQGTAQAQNGSRVINLENVKVIL